MSAITGIFYRDGRNVDEKQIKKMNDRLSHRGPDGSAIWCEGPVALGHQMLHTTPESLNEKLPFEEDGLVITADARIDNRKELSVKLEIEDKEEVSDSYFILKAYQKWGEKCPEELLGDFAFAIWDKDQEKLFCARDHMGVKPFYYYLDDSVFYFSTEIKSILCSSEISIRLNELKVAFHLIPIVTDRELTFYEKINRLPAAQIQIIELKTRQKRIYWRLDPEIEINLNCDEDYYKRFREIFKEAVKCRLRCNYKIGFELSGGIDSSSVLQMAKNIFHDHKNTNFYTFSLIFNEIKSVDESYYIKKVVETGRIKPYYLVADFISPFEEIEEILFYQEEPLATPNMAMIWQIYKKMHKNGVKVILGGHDGDSVFYKGEKYLMELFINLRWKKLIKEINSIHNGKILDKFKLFISKVIFPLSPVLFDFWLKFKGIRSEKDFVNINKNFQQCFNLKKLYKELELSHYRKANNSKKMHYYYLTLGTHQYIFEMMDKFAGANSMEARHPIMDKRLVEFCFAVPTHIKYDQGWGRLLVRYGLADLLPKEIRWRREKCNFFHVFERNLLLFEKSRLNNLLYQNELIRDFIDCNGLKKIYQRFMDEKEGADSIDIWKTAILSIWLKNNQYLYPDVTKD